MTDELQPANPGLTEPRLRRRSHDRASVEALAERYRTWGRWGADDELGAANYVTPERVIAATACVRRGAVFSLALPMDRSGPQTGQTARVNPQHVMLRTPQDPLGYGEDVQRATDDAVYMPLQSSTQWDALCHMFHDGRTYNGRGPDSVTARDGAVRNSITNFKDRALGRGVLLDVPRHLGRSWLFPGEAIQAEDLERCADAQGVAVGEGDFLLVRTGQLAQVRDAGTWGTYAGGDAPGLGVSAAEFICGHQVAAIATDTWGIEAKPYEAPDTVAPLHVVLLVHAGVYIGEMWDTEALAADCAQDGVYEFFLCAVPLTITGAVGSPINPIAIK